MGQSMGKKLVWQYAGGGAAAAAAANCDYIAFDDGDNDLDVGVVLLGPDLDAT